MSAFQSRSAAAGNRSGVGGLGRKTAASPTPAALRHGYGVGGRGGGTVLESGVVNELTAEQREEINQAFQMFDTGRRGALDYHELKVAMRALGFEASKQDVLKIIKDHAHTPRDGGSANAHLLYYEDFDKVMRQKILQRDPEEEIRRAFALFDEEGSGRISLENLKRVARDLNEHVDEAELAAMIDEFDLDGDGEISLEEFTQIMRDEH
ncbi:Calcium-binding component of the spindle pole body (SPB) half-bridge [Savitreella phatthalungensis]